MRFWSRAVAGSGVGGTALMSVLRVNGSKSDVTTNCADVTTYSEFQQCRRDVTPTSVTSPRPRYARSPHRPPSSYPRDVTTHAAAPLSPIGRGGLVSLVTSSRTAPRSAIGPRLSRWRQGQDGGGTRGGGGGGRARARGAPEGPAGPRALPVRRVGAPRAPGNAGRDRSARAGCGERSREGRAGKRAGIGVT